MPFGQLALSLAAQLQLDGPGTDGPTEPGADIGRELVRLVAQAQAVGRNPELELRAAACRYLDLVVAWERSWQSGCRLGAFAFSGAFH